jgi:hypothetical protein
MVSNSGHDHGPLYASTQIGQLEYASPMLITLVPQLMTKYKHYHRVIENLAHNQNKLIVPCDLFTTLSNWMLFPNVHLETDESDNNEQWKQWKQTLQQSYQQYNSKLFDSSGVSHHHSCAVLYRQQISDHTICSTYPNDAYLQTNCQCPSLKRKPSLSRKDMREMQELYMKHLIPQSIEWYNSNSYVSNIPSALKIARIRKILYSYRNVNHLKRVTVIDVLRMKTSGRSNSINNNNNNNNNTMATEFTKIIYSVDMDNGDWQVFESLYEKSKVVVSHGQEWKMVPGSMRRISTEHGNKCPIPLLNDSNKVSNEQMLTNTELYICK